MVAFNCSPSAGVKRCAQVTKKTKQNTKATVCHVHMHHTCAPTRHSLRLRQMSTRTHMPTPLHTHTHMTMRPQWVTGILFFILICLFVFTWILWIHFNKQSQLISFGFIFNFSHHQPLAAWCVTIATSGQNIPWGFSWILFEKKRKRKEKQPN